MVLRQASVNTVIQYTDVNRLPMHSVTSSKDRHVPVAGMDTAVITVPVSGKIPATSHVTGHARPLRVLPEGGTWCPNLQLSTHKSVSRSTAEQSLQSGSLYNAVDSSKYWGAKGSSPV